MAQGGVALSVILSLRAQLLADGAGRLSCREVQARLAQAAQAQAAAPSRSPVKRPTRLFDAADFVVSARQDQTLTVMQKP